MHAAVGVGVGVDGGDTVIPPAVQVVAERVPEALLGALALAVGVLAELDYVVGPVALGQAVGGGVDGRCEVEVEAGSEKVSRIGVSVAGESLEYFIIQGDTPLQVRYSFLE